MEDLAAGQLKGRVRWEGPGGGADGGSQVGGQVKARWEEVGVDGLLESFYTCQVFNCCCYSGCDSPSKPCFSF